MDIVLALMLGVSLAASCGFRVFTPLLVLGLAGRFANFPVAELMSWTATDTGLVCLGCATLLEILAYYIPWVDHALDSVSTPLALVAGTLVVGGQLEGMPDALQWGVAVVGGGGAAGAVQLGTVSLRAVSSAVTGGLGNFAVSTGENIMALVGAVLSIIVPVAAFIGILLMGLVIWRIVRSRRAVQRATS